MANIQYIDLVESDKDGDESSVKCIDNVHDANVPVIKNWYSDKELKLARLRLEKDKLKLAKERELLRKYRLAKRRMNVEKNRLDRKMRLLEKRKKLTWINPKPAPKRPRGRNAPVGHPGIELLVAAHRVKVKDLIKETQKEVLNRLPKVRLLRQVPVKQVERLLVGFQRFTVQKIGALREINSVFYDYDNVTGGTVFHVERLIQELESVVNNIDDYVLAQLDTGHGHLSLRKVRWHPAHWKGQHVLASLWTHLENERAKLQRLHASYIAVSREPPVIPPFYLEPVDSDNEGSQKI